MFLAGEQNCTAQRPLVTQIKGDSAEGERAVRVFLLPEKWGRCVVFILPLHPPLALPRCNNLGRGEELCLPKSLVSEVTVTLLALVLSKLFPVLCGFTGSSRELWCPHWAVFGRLGEGALGGLNQCLHFDHHDVTAAWLLTAFKHLCSLLHQTSPLYAT